MVGEAGDARTAVELAAACRPDVVIMDVSLPGLSGVESTRQVLGRAPEVKVVALSVHDDHALRRRHAGGGGLQGTW